MAKVQGRSPGFGLNAHLIAGEGETLDGAGLSGDVDVSSHAVQLHCARLGGDVGGHGLGHPDRVSDLAACVVVSATGLGEP